MIIQNGGFPNEDPGTVFSAMGSEPPTDDGSRIGISTRQVSLGTGAELQKMMKKLANRYLTGISYAASSEETDKKPGPSPCLAIYATCVEVLDSFRTHIEREGIA